MYNGPDNRITGVFPSTEIQKVRLIGNVYLRFNADNYVLGGQIKPSMLSSSDDIVSYNVSLAGDEYLVVAVTGADLIASLDSRIETIENSPLG